MPSPKMLADLKKMAEESDIEGAAMLSKSKDPESRRQAAEMSKRAADKTSAMISAGPSHGYRISDKGKRTGKALEKNPATGLYITEDELKDEVRRETRNKAPKAYVKGGSVRGAGIAQRGVKACKTC